jgi:hypothetical protein
MAPLRPSAGPGSAMSVAVTVGRQGLHQPIFLLKFQCRSQRLGKGSLQRCLPTCGIVVDVGAAAWKLSGGVNLHTVRSTNKPDQ